MNSKGTKAVRRIGALALCGLSLAALTACDSVTDSVSDVGEQEQLAPMASAKLIGTTGPTRSGSEVILSAGDSEGRSAPILDFSWAQTSGPTVELVKRSQSTVSFTVPDADDGTSLGFQLTVTDSNGMASTAAVPTVTVVRARDPNQFLTYLSGVSGKFRVVAATNTAGAIASDVRFTIAVDTVVTYPDRNDVMREATVASEAVEGAWLAASGTGGPDRDAPENPRFSFDVPAFELDAINAQYQNAAPGSAERDLILDEWKIDQAEVNVVVTLTCLDACGDPADASRDNVLLIVANDTADTTIASEANSAAAVPTSIALPVGDVETGELRENRDTAQAYYNTIDPDAERTTLFDWMRVNGFDPEAPEFGADAHTVYVNNYDLGFGRDMYIRTDPVTGYVASFVTNYPNLESATRRQGAFVTVAMEYSPGAAGGEPFAKFFNFVPDGTGDSVRSLSMNFDGRGEKFLPGVCTACHGGAPAAADDIDFETMTYPDQGDIHTTFMPWDLDSFLFASGPDADPSYTSPPGVDDSLLTRASQEAAFAALNAAAFCTYDPDDPRYAAAVELVSGWYGGQVPDCDSGVPMFAGTFDGTYTQPGWENEPELYHGVYARNCRACHTQFDLTDSGGTELQFATYDDFIAPTTLTGLVYEDGAMPLARLTMDRFWANFEGSGASAGELLAAHLENLDDTDDVAAGSLVAPGDASVAVTGLPAVPSRNEVIRLDASGSRFADTYSWTLDAPTASVATVVGQDTDQLSFAPDAPGTYQVSLTVNAGQSDEATTVLDAIEVPNQAPSAASDVYVLDLSQSLTVDVPAPGLLDNDADGEGDSLAVADDSVLVIDDATRRLVIRADGSLTYEYRGDPIQPALSVDMFDYAAQDAFGALSNVADISINLLAAPDDVQPTPPSLDSAVASSTANGAASTFSVTLDWSGAADNVGVTSYNVYRNPPRSTDPISVSGTSYEDTATLGAGAELVPGTSYEYTVTAVDGAGNESATASNALTVTTHTSYRSEVDAIWANRGCLSCHGTSGGLTLGNAEPSDNHAEIVSDQDNEGPRINLSNVPASLILCKALDDSAGGCTHTGGTTPFDDTSDADYITIFDWLSEGATDN